MDIKNVLNDPELGSAAFTVEKITYIRSREETTSCSSIVQTAGCIHPGTPDMLQLLPEEERQETFIVIYTDYPLSTGTPEDTGASSFTAPDRVHWNNQTWRVVRVRDWQGFGYCQALAILLQEEDV